MSKNQGLKKLEQRLTDIYSGAVGIVFDVCHYGSPVPTDLSRIVPVVRGLFEVEEGEDGWRFSDWHLEFFEDPETLADFLHGCGVRA